MKFTHEGRVCCKYGNYRVIKLRETKTQWVSDNNERFRKSNGVRIGDDRWTLVELELNTIKNLEVS